MHALLNIENIHANRQNFILSLTYCYIYKCVRLHYCRGIGLGKQT